jgi:hypothetical protein
MYVPKHQFTIKRLASTESRVQYEDGTPYTKGSYVELSNGSVYDVPNDDLQKGDFSRARKLINAFLPLVVGTGLLILKSFIAKKKAGEKTITRYFIRHKSAKQVIEVSEEGFKAELQNPVSYKQGVSLPWQISGPVQDYEVNGFRYEGVVTKNKRAVEEAKKTIPTLDQYITDYAFLAEDVEKYEAATDRTPDRFYIPSPSKTVGR